MHKRKFLRVLVVGALVLGAATLLPSSASANLAGSTFEGNDGNFIPNGGTDWTSPPPNFVNGPDTPSGQLDTAFGQGTAENDVNVTVVRGSIPNNKADLANFLAANEQGANGHTYLYLGWTRANQGGTTNFDFEVNKLAQPDLSTPGPKTLVRSTGDLLINYLFQGQGTPQIQIRTWTGTAWSAPTSGVVAEAAISTASLANPFGSPNPVPSGQFGETSIDLTASGVIPPGACEGFSSAYVKSRSSTSFNSEVKDLVPPQHLNFNTCAFITVVKQTVPSPDPTDSTFSYTSNFMTPLNFTLKDGGSLTSGQLNAGTYAVAETDPGPNWAVTSSCDDGSPVSAISLQANEHVTCTFVNTLQTGAMTIHKQRKHAADGPGNHPQSGVTFTVNGTTTPATDANGDTCVDGLLFGSYTVHENVPAGYQGEADKTVQVDNFATCAGGGGESVTFTNTPLTNLSVTVDSQVAGGTSSTVSCTNGGPSAGPGDDITASATDLPPGTYVCTVVIDP